MKKSFERKELSKGNGKFISKEEKIFNVVMIIMGIIVSILCLYPLYYVLIASVSKPLLVDNGSVMFWVKGFNLDSYKEVIAKKEIWVAYGNTIYYTVAGVVVNMFFTTTMAYALSKERLPFRRTLTFLTVFTMWFQAGMIPLYMTFKDYHLLNTRTAVILGFALNTYNLIILKSFFEQVPKSLEEAAFMDGANNLKIFARVYLPLSKPSLVTVGMFYAVGRWNGYFWAMNLLRKDNMVPLQVLLKRMIVDRVANAQDAALVTMDSITSPTTIIYATIIIAIIPMMIVYPSVQKHFKKGATVGAVKG